VALRLGAVASVWPLSVAASSAWWSELVAPACAMATSLRCRSDVSRDALNASGGAAFATYVAPTKSALLPSAQRYGHPGKRRMVWGLWRSGAWMARGPPQGRVSAGCLSGTAARLREGPARCAGPDRRAALTKGWNNSPTGRLLRRVASEAALLLAGFST